MQPLISNIEYDTNKLGIVWMGNVNIIPGYPAYIGNTNCYYDLSFSKIGSPNCGVVRLTTDIIDKTDCDNIINVDEKPEGDKYDIFGRKVVNVLPKNIYIQNGKKYIETK